MTKNLKTADTIVKLILAVTVLIFYFTRLISGPFAMALMFLSLIVILIFLIQLFFTKVFMD
ncbi:MAG: DUF2892 domain-containing protein [Cyclobacteriaceae bacterium]